MKRLLFFILILAFIACTSSNTAKMTFISDVKNFVESTKIDIENGVEIDWESKLDSLATFRKKKTVYKLNPTEEKKIKEQFAWIESKSKRKVDPIEKENEIVNFYFENSASMNGYLKQKNFQQTVNRIYLNIEELKRASYFVNTKEHPQTDIISKINEAKVKVGDTGNSDHKFIFENAIKNASGNNLSIVITDGIYSVKKGNLNLVSIEIENAFKKALKVSEIESVILKMSSNFDGFYYSETCEAGKKRKKINQKRPYYVIMFGNAEKINEALEKIAIVDELPGYEQRARFSLTKNIKASYTILVTGEEKHGSFEASNKGSDIVQNISEVEKFERRGFGGTPKEENYLQLGIAVDFSNTNLPESYLKDIKNYSLNEELSYTITSIVPVSELDKTGITYKRIQKINKNNNLNLSHVIAVKSSEKLYGSLEISLNNNLPKWIKETGDDDDCDIKNDTEKTFAFDELMIGISKAYDKINDKKEVLKININIKA